MYFHRPNTYSCAMYFHRPNTHSRAMYFHRPNAHTHVPWTVTDLMHTLMCHGVSASTYSNRYCAVDFPARPQQLLFPMLVQRLTQPSDQIPARHCQNDVPFCSTTDTDSRAICRGNTQSVTDSDTMTAFFHWCFLQTERYINTKYGARNKGNIALCNQELNSGMLSSGRTVWHVLCGEERISKRRKLWVEKGKTWQKHNKIHFGIGKSHFVCR
jgi:hypothetical protein